MKILWGAKFFGAPFLWLLFLKCFADVFLKCFAAGVGCQESLRFFLKCFAAGWGTKIGFAHLESLPAGVTENKES